MSSLAERKRKISPRAHNAKLAIALLENGLKDGRVAAAQKAAIAVLLSPERVSESVELVRFRKPSSAALKKAASLENSAADLLRRG